MRVLIGFVALGALLAAPMAAAERIAESGDFVVDLDQHTPGQGGDPFMPECNILVNPGFETGELPPWTTTNWIVTNEDAHSGVYSAEDYGNYWIRQDFDPVDVSEITSITVWYKQPEVAISAIDYYYGPSDYDEFLVWMTGPDWTFFDVTSELRPVGMLQAIRIWGYSGGGPDPDLTRLDDVAIEIEGGTPAEGTTWGDIKAFFR